MTVALNLFRNARTSRARRAVLLGGSRGESTRPDPEPAPDARLLAEDERHRVRTVLDRLPERERQLLLLRAEDYSYRDLAVALKLHEASVGVLLARARRAFRVAWEEGNDASR